MHTRRHTHTHTYTNTRTSTHTHIHTHTHTQDLICWQYVRYPCSGQYSLTSSVVHNKKNTTTNTEPLEKASNLYIRKLISERAWGQLPSLPTNLIYFVCRIYVKHSTNANDEVIGCTVPRCLHRISDNRYMQIQTNNKKHMWGTYTQNVV